MKSIIILIKKIKLIIKFFYNILTKRAFIFYYTYPQRKRIIRLINQIKRERETSQHDVELYNLFMLVEQTKEIKGNIAEVGVYNGGSAKLISEIKGNKSLYLFDTFNGIPIITKEDDRVMRLREFHSSENKVRYYLKKYDNIKIYKGIFPLSAKPIENKKFSFVHLDVDVYKSTLDCLKIFYPRMNKGGIILSHDYYFLDGVKKAFDEFFRDKPEKVIGMPASQCFIIKK